MHQLRILLVSEFPAQSGAPTGALASDLVEFLTIEKKASVRFINVSKTYAPGGLAWSRLWNLVYLNFVIGLIFPVEFLRAIIAKNKLCVVATTSPPLIQWSCALLARFIRVPVVVWYQDAHPEIEARALEKLRFFRLAKLLRAIDRSISQNYASFVTLDEAMLRTFLHRTQFDRTTGVIPPWGTYIEPAKEFRALPQKKNSLRLIYAGNYGKVHDLTPLAQVILTLAESEKRHLSITFVGMSDEAKDKLIALFLPTDLKLVFKPRFPTINQLLKELDSYDLGIVSLANDREGVACPSKALTYLSQGLPILYVGPPHTLPWQLCRKGWGLLFEELFKDARINCPDQLQVPRGSVFPNPKKHSQEKFYNFILSTLEGYNRSSTQR